MAISNEPYVNFCMVTDNKNTYTFCSKCFYVLVTKVENVRYFMFWRILRGRNLYQLQLQAYKEMDYGTVEWLIYSFRCHRQN
jgi:hypothetical protein